MGMKIRYDRTFFFQTSFGSIRQILITKIKGNLLYSMGAKIKDPKCLIERQKTLFRGNPNLSGMKKSQKEKSQCFSFSLV